MRSTFHSRRSFLFSTTGALFTSAVPALAGARSAVPTFAFLRGPWTTLHHRLFEQSKIAGVARPHEYVTGLNAAVRADLGRIASGDRPAWDESLAIYRRVFGSQRTFDPSFASIMAAVADVDRGGSLRSSASPPEISRALRSALPIQRHIFERPDANDEGAWLLSAHIGVRQYGATLAPDLSRIFGVRWPDKVFGVHIVPYTDPFGAYSYYGSRTAFIAVSRALPILRIVPAAVETLYHEAAHSIVSPEGSPVGDAIADAARRANRDVPRSLWHAIIFFTVGTLVERLTARAGSSYTMMGRGPGTADVFGRVWQAEFAALERFWTPWIDGHGSLTDAIRRVVASLPTSR